MRNGTRALFTFQDLVDIGAKTDSRKSRIMKTTRLLPVLFFASLLISTGCNKDDDDEPAPTRSALLTSKNWIGTNVSINPAIDFDQNGTQETDLYPFVPLCSRDDFYKFNVNASFTEEEGASKCDVNDTQIISTGIWVWNSDETILTISEQGAAPFEALVTQLSATSMTWEQTQSINGVVYVVTITYI